MSVPFFRSSHIYNTETQRLDFYHHFIEDPIITDEDIPLIIIYIREYIDRFTSFDINAKHLTLKGISLIIDELEKQRFYKRVYISDHAFLKVKIPFISKIIKKSLCNICFWARTPRGYRDEDDNEVILKKEYAFAWYKPAIYCFLEAEQNKQNATNNFLYKDGDHALMSRVMSFFFPLKKFK